MKDMNPKKQRLISASVAVGVGLLVALGQAAWAGSVSLPWTFTNGTIADANQVNANFQALQTGVNDNDARIAALERSIAALTDKEWSRWTVPPLSPPGSNYIVSASTVKDNLTGLVWQRNVDANTHTWNDALTYCASLNVSALGGYSTGWRLPTLTELESILDYSKATDVQRTGPWINESAFPYAPYAYFWSSSINAAQEYFSWAVSFAGGETVSDHAANSNGVRCVR